MPVRIFCVQGHTLIGGLESEINNWQKSIGSKASVTHLSTAMTEYKVPMHSLGTPDEVAKIIYVLCTETSSYVNGAEIHINGGQHV